MGWGGYGPMYGGWWIMPLFWILLLGILFFILRRFITRSCNQGTSTINLSDEALRQIREELRALRKEIEELKKRLPPPGE
ncbi:MAG: hypothetical protein CVU61_10455 [Deltaproteobacteria bacterium HGW-Deltaproteobacteria-19]|jgi:uncharacterized membrane protein|nr:MAG: hypothetical protein CVU61_10455 [Deltaproteobacteria bacterium HGW-Deltaproteobacteria-19]